MRFVKAFVWLLIVTFFFIGLLAAVSYPPLEFPIGQGNPISNVSYYILDDNPNRAMFQNDLLRYTLAQKFLQLGVYKLLIFLLVFWTLISLIWIIVSELLKIDRPGKAVKFVWLWFIFFIVSILFPAVMTYYFLYIQDDIWQLAGAPQIASLITFIIIYSGLFFYLCSIFITSRVLRPAVPFLTFILRN